MSWSLLMHRLAVLSSWFRLKRIAVTSSPLPMGTLAFLSSWPRLNRIAMMSSALLMRSPPKAYEEPLQTDDSLASPRAKHTAVRCFQGRIDCCRCLGDHPTHPDELQLDNRAKPTYNSAFLRRERSRRLRLLWKPSKAKGCCFCCVHHDPNHFSSSYPLLASFEWSIKPTDPTSKSPKYDCTHLAWIDQVESKS